MTYSIEQLKQGWEDFKAGHEIQNHLLSVIPELIAELEAKDREIANRRKLEEQLIVRYSVAFVNYAYTGPDAAIDLMAAEISTLRVEKQAIRLQTARECAEIAEGYSLGTCTSTCIASDIREKFNL